MVDVAIPTMGSAPYLSEAIGSVVAQSFSDWRLLVSEDDAAQGRARELCRSLGDPRIRFTATPAARNAARHKTYLIRAGTAPYVAILDDDDRWGPDHLERRLGFLQRHPECALVFSRSRIIDAQGGTLEETDLRLEEGVLEGREFIRRLLRMGNFVNSSSVLVRRSAYEAVGSGYDPRFVIGYDLEMWLRLATVFPVGYLDSADVEYRLHPGQATQAPLDCQERVRLLDHLEAVLAQALPDLPFDSHYPRRRRALCLLGAGLDAAEHGDRSAARRYVRRAAKQHPIAFVHPAATAILAAGALRGAGPGALRWARSQIRSLPRPLETREKAKAMGRLRLGSAIDRL